MNYKAYLEGYLSKEANPMPLQKQPPTSQQDPNKLLPNIGENTSTSAPDPVIPAPIIPGTKPATGLSGITPAPAAVQGTKPLIPEPFNKI